MSCGRAGRWDNRTSKPPRSRTGDTYPAQSLGSPPEPWGFVSPATVPFFSPPPPQESAQELRGRNSQIGLQYVRCGTEDYVCIDVDVESPRASIKGLSVGLTRSCTAIQSSPSATGSFCLPPPPYVNRQHEPPPPLLVAHFSPLPPLPRYPRDYKSIALID